MIQSAENKVIVEVTTKYTGNISDLVNRSAIQNNASVHVEDMVNICGKIISLPKRISKKREYSGFSTKDIMVGDIAIFSFNVIYDFFQNEPNGKLIYKNMISYQGKEYFQADITRVFGVIRNGSIIMINGYVMCQPVKEDILYVPSAAKRAKVSKSSMVMHIGLPRETVPSISVNNGDTVYFNPSIAQKYQINNKPFIILNQHQILGKVIVA